MNTKPRLDPDDPQIKAAFSGVYKSSAKVFFRINPDGSHRQIPVFRELDGINITHDCKMALIKEFPFEQLSYLSQRMKAALAAAKKPKRLNATDDDEDKELESDFSEFSGAKKSQYSLV